MRRRGAGVANRLINALPFELHVPGYQFCGPGTRLDERLARGDRGINPLDRACREHDIAYAHHPEDLGERHAADRVLRKAALKRVVAPDARLSERAAALLTAGVMTGKLALGAGLGGKKRKRKTMSKTKKKVVGVRRLGVAKKVGGVLPIVLGVLGALGALASGASSIATAVKRSQQGDKALLEQVRHNLAMEAKAGRGGKRKTRRIPKKKKKNKGRGSGASPASVERRGHSRFY